MFKTLNLTDAFGRTQGRLGWWDSRATWARKGRKAILGPGYMAPLMTDWEVAQSRQSQSQPFSTMFFFFMPAVCGASCRRTRT